MRTKFPQGRQRQFLQNVLLKVGSPTIKELSERLQISYSTFKNYFNESRCLPKTLFEDLCFLAKISKAGLNFQEVEDNWGQVKGGRILKVISF